MRNRKADTNFNFTAYNNKLYDNNGNGFIMWFFKPNYTFLITNTVKKLNTDLYL